MTVAKFFFLCVLLWSIPAVIFWLKQRRWIETVLWVALLALSLAALLYL